MADQTQLVLNPKRGHARAPDHLRLACFALGMAGVIVMAGMSAGHLDLSLIGPFALGAVFAALTRLPERYVGPDWLLYSFCGLGLVQALLWPLVLRWQIGEHLLAKGLLGGLLRLALFAAFCAVALQTRPPSRASKGGL